MLRANIFSLLSIVSSRNFLDSIQIINAVKDGCPKFLAYDDSELLKVLNLSNIFDGWQYIINDMLLNKY